MKLCKTAGSIHLLKIKGAVKSENIKLNKLLMGHTRNRLERSHSLSFNE